MGQQAVGRAPTTSARSPRAAARTSSASWATSPPSTLAVTPVARTVCATSRSASPVSSTTRAAAVTSATAPSSTSASTCTVDAAGRAWMRRCTSTESTVPLPDRARSRLNSHGYVRSSRSLRTAMPMPSQRRWAVRIIARLAAARPAWACSAPASSWASPLIRGSWCCSARAIARAEVMLRPPPVAPRPDPDPMDQLVGRRVVRRRCLRPLPVQRERLAHRTGGRAVAGCGAHPTQGVDHVIELQVGRAGQPGEVPGRLVGERQPARVVTAAEMQDELLDRRAAQGHPVLLAASDREDLALVVAALTGQQEGVIATAHQVEHHLLGSPAQRAGGAVGADHRDQILRQCVDLRQRAAGHERSDKAASPRSSRRTRGRRTRALPGRPVGAGVAPPGCEWHQGRMKSRWRNCVCGPGLVELHPVGKQQAELAEPLAAEMVAGHDQQHAEAREGRRENSGPGHGSPSARSFLSMMAGNSSGRAT